MDFFEKLGKQNIAELSRKSTQNILKKSPDKAGLEWGTLRKCEDDAFELAIAPILDSHKHPIKANHNLSMSQHSSIATAQSTARKPKIC